MTYQHNPDQINQLADKLEDPELDTKGLGWKAAFHLRELQGRIAELEERMQTMLDCVNTLKLAADAAAGIASALEKENTNLMAERDYLKENVGSLVEETFLLDSMFAALGAGGVGQSIKPAAQVDTAQELENLRCKSTQKRLATLWGYEKARQPLTDEQIWRSLNDTAMKAQANAGYPSPKALIEIARAIESAHGITGSQQ